ncbi:hypothetical protein ACH41E_33560 [Streptomyces sp. NPDC020412]
MKHFLDRFDKDGGTGQHPDRYVLKMEPVASASPEELIELLTPTVQRYPG